jgi:hypothetical protein
MRADRFGEVGGGQGDLANVERGFVAFGPAAGGWLLHPGKAMHAGGLDDQPVPGAIELPGEVEGFDRSMLLSAMLVTNNRLVPVARRL